MNMRLNTFYRLGTSLISLSIMSLSHAGIPVWTVTPAPGNNPTQTINTNGIINLQYVVQNNSLKSKRLAMLPIQGVQQPGLCVLAPRNNPGSTCNLNLVINGSAVPPSGIHDGPALCETDINGVPNRNQCYQPSAINSLNITKGDVAPSAVLSINPSTLNLIPGGAAQTVVLNNESNFTAENLQVVIPAGSNVTLDPTNTTCTTTLLANSNCVYSFQPGAQVESSTKIQIKASNSNLATLTVNVSATFTTLSVSSLAPQPYVVDVNSGTLEFTVTNTGQEVATNIIATANTPWNGVALTPDAGCASLAPSDSCTVSVSATEPNLVGNFAIQGTNTDTINTADIAFNFEGGLVFAKDTVEGLVKVLSLTDFGLRPWDADPACAPPDLACTQTTGALSFLYGLNLLSVPGSDNPDGTGTDGPGNTYQISLVLNGNNGNSNTTPGTYAAGACISTNESGFTDWYLPALCEWSSNGCGEIIPNINENLALKGFGNFPTPANLYWTSTEDGTSPNIAAYSRLIPSTGGGTESQNKSDGLTVRCIRVAPYGIP